MKNIISSLGTLTVNWMQMCVIAFAILSIVMWTIAAVAPRLYETKDWYTMLFLNKKESIVGKDYKAMAKETFAKRMIIEAVLFVPTVVLCILSAVKVIPYLVGIIYAAVIAVAGIGMIVLVKIKNKKEKTVNQNNLQQDKNEDSDE